MATNAIARKEAPSGEAQHHQEDRQEWASAAPHSRWWGNAVVVAVLSTAVGTVAHAEPIVVRVPEVSSYALVTLSAVASGQTLADGELTQTGSGRGRLLSRLTFRFRDGSLSDETVVFSQDKVFRVHSYHVIQRGRSFPHAIDAAVDRATARYRVRYRESADASEERVEGTTEMPDDLYNGMGATLVRNLDGRRGAGHLLAFTPKPRLLRADYIPEGEGSFTVGGAARRARRYLMKIEVAGPMGGLAHLIGKDPPDVLYWVANPVPAFLKFEGQMFLKGPLWRIEPTRARWVK